MQWVVMLELCTLTSDPSQRLPVPSAQVDELRAGITHIASGVVCRCREKCLGLFHSVASAAQPIGEESVQSAFGAQRVSAATHFEHVLTQCYWPGILANLPATNERYHFYTDNAPKHGVGLHSRVHSVEQAEIRGVACGATTHKPRQCEHPKPVDTMVSSIIIVLHNVDMSVVPHI